ncbi:hypothetical protein Tco_0874048 [Tanacetum coccineum]|uniref:Uncharacterized protein n=1 Tax=Tanacetum coccineum TaxID=301880 RepID=A0ABQ5BNG2_9ASTR
MSTYLKHMGEFTYKQLKGKNFDEIQKLFDKEMKRSGSKRRCLEEKEEDNSNKKNPQRNKKWRKKVSDEDERSQCEGDDRRVIKAKHNDTRPEDEFERVLWGDLKVMFEPDTTSDVWRMLQGYRVTIWKLIDSSGVHFVRNLKIQKLNIKFRGGLLRLERLQGHLRILLHRLVTAGTYILAYAQFVLLVYKDQLVVTYRLRLKNCATVQEDKDQSKNNTIDCVEKQEYL